MKTVGIIAEYNPFHNGHAYQIQKIKEQTNADYIIVVMSGNYIQRGTPAIIHKYARATMALQSGVDIVLELPVRYATSSAEYFAMGAIALLDNLGCVDMLCFGSEHGDLQALSALSTLYQKEPPAFQNQIKRFIKQGLSFPMAREKATAEYFLQENKNELSQLLSSPNNILGIEYLKALHILKSSVTPITIKRTSSDYHSNKLSFDKISSASAIRSQIFMGAFSSIKAHVPKQVYEELEKAYQVYFPIIQNDFSSLLYYTLHAPNHVNFTHCADVSPELAKRMNRFKHSFTTFEALSNDMKTKQYTKTRVDRSLLHILLQIPQYTIKEKATTDIVPYGRILGLNKKASPLLRNASIPIITKLADAHQKLSTDAIVLLEEDIFATHLYNRIIQEKFHYCMRNEYQISPIFI